MTLGSGVFLSSLVLGTVVLYLFTRDRWSWRRIGGVTAAGASALILVAAGVTSWNDARQERDAAGQVEENRRRREIVIGDHLVRVLQRQGVPDTIFNDAELGLVVGYWDDYKNMWDSEKIFYFTPDSIVREIRFIGDRTTLIEYGWQPDDGITLGVSQDSVLSSLGKPCAQKVDERRTMMSFVTANADVTRFVAVRHGDGSVVRHGWIQGHCTEN